MSGSVTGEDVFRAMAATYAHELWAKDFDVVWDLTSVRHLLFEWQDYHQWIDLDTFSQEHVGNGRDLLLVGNELHEAVAKSYAVLAKKSGRKAEVFRTQSALQAALKSR